MYSYPSTGETVLYIESASTEKTIDETTEWDMEVYSETQLLKEKRTKLKGKNYTIQTYGWQDGVYMVRLKFKEEVFNRQAGGEEDTGKTEDGGFG